MMAECWGMGMGWGMWFLPLFTILVIYLLFKNKLTDRHISESPLEILKKRYAKGEINKEQYEAMKKDIGA